MSSARPATIRTLLGWLLLVGAAGCVSDRSDEDALPLFAAPPVHVGVLSCYSGPFSARAPTLEEAALLGAEYINGSTSAFASEPSAIPCRQRDNCGIWSVNREDGSVERGMLRPVLVNTEEAPDAAVAAARAVVERYDPVALVGFCRDDVLQAVFSQVSGTDIPIVTPIVSEDVITFLVDHPGGDPSRPGSVYRTTSPRYVHVDMAGLLARNKIGEQPLVHFDDHTLQACRQDAECQNLGASFRCRIPSQKINPKREYVTRTDVACSDRPSGYCDRYGRNYECIALDGKPSRCAQYRLKRVCTRVIRPELAIVLFENTDSGNNARERIRQFWHNRELQHILAEASFEPGNFRSASAAVGPLLQASYAEFLSMKSDGTLGSDARFEDVVVFVFATAQDGIALMLSWAGESVRYAGADGVFWVALDGMLSRLVVDQLHFSTVRDLFVIDPATTDPNSAAFFDTLFRGRWQRPPGPFSANLFDALLLVAGAAEAAGRQARESGSASQTLSAGLVRDNIELVSAGCRRSTTAQSCDAITGGLITAIAPSDFAAGIEAVSNGTTVRFQGVTGDLSLSPAGDRLGPVGVWKVGEDLGKGAFMEIGVFTPQSSGVGLEF